MRLFEITAEAFYLCTTQKYYKNEVLEPRPVYPLGSAIEGKIEYRRPETAIPRDHSFYLLREPKEAAYVYLVEPIGPLDRHHTSWLKLLAKTPISQGSEIDSYAGGYWSGKPWPEDQDARYEFRAARVKILMRVGK